MFTPRPADYSRDDARGRRSDATAQATKRITQTMFVHYDTDRSCEVIGWSRYTLDRSEWKGDRTRIFVGAVEVSFDVPADFDPRPAQVKALEAKRRELEAQFAAAVVEINRQISQLQAIEHTPEVA